MTQKKFEKVVIKVTIPYTLHDWSESLTFDEINDTLFLIGMYTDEEYKQALSTSDRTRIEQWLKKNDVKTFMRAQELASIAYNTALENEVYAQEIIGMPYKRPRSH